MKDVYTLSDLRQPHPIFLQEDKPARLAVIGDPVAHSKSPQLHQPALDALGLNCTYVRIHLTAEEFTEGVGLMQELGFIGCNCTVPHKERALEWAKKPDSFASQLGVANTILFPSNECYTTDPIGCQNAVKEELGRDFADSRILILGAAGGAGSAVAQYITRHDYRHLSLYNRTTSKLETLKSKISTAGYWNSDKISLCGAGTFPNPDEIDLIINATSLGLKPEQGSPIPAEFLSPSHAVYDMTYGCQNQLAIDCQKAGAQYADGLSMLTHQGAAAFKLWFPDTNPVMGL